MTTMASVATKPVEIVRPSLRYCRGYIHKVQTGEVPMRETGTATSGM